MDIKNFFIYQIVKKREMSRAGFTLLEMLLVVTMIAILAGIVIFAINPGKQLAEARNAQRRSDVNAILNAVYQYAIDNKGVLPPGIPVGDTSFSVDICDVSPANGGDCSGRVDFSILFENERYLTSMPKDPSCPDGANSSCYSVVKSANGRITISASQAELGATISVTR